METFDKDTSGLDVLITPDTQVSNAAKTLDAVDEQKPSPKPKVYNKSEVAIRWGTNSYQVDKEISAGMPMFKMPNGRWEITEDQLCAWEEKLEQERINERRRKTASTIAAIVIFLLVIVIGAAIIFFTPLKDDISNAFSGSSIAQPQPRASTQTNPYSNLTSDYVFSDSNTRYLRESEVSALTEEQCMIARNEIAARHGRSFNDADLQEYFSGKSWYSPTVSAEEYDASASSYLNEFEQANSALIREIEDKKGFNQ